MTATPGAGACCSRACSGNQILCSRPFRLRSAVERIHPSTGDPTTRCTVRSNSHEWIRPGPRPNKNTEVDSMRAGTVTVVPRRRRLPRCIRAGTRALALAESVSSSAAAVFWSPRPVAPAAVPGPSPASLPPPASSSAAAARVLQRRCRLVVATASSPCCSAGPIAAAGHVLQRRRGGLVPLHQRVLNEQSIIQAIAN